MKILIPFDRLTHGGHQTLIVRLCNWWVGNGHSVVLLLESRAELDTLLSPSVETIYTGTNPLRFLGLFWPDAAAQAVRSCDIIFVVGAYSILMANALMRHTGRNPRIVFGMYHPRGFFRYTKWNFSNWAGERIFKSLPDRNILFMTDFYKSNHFFHYRSSYTDSFVVPLPIVDHGARKSFSRPETDIIVSIGRLTAFKTYNLHMIEVVSRLLAGGHSVEWHVYGSGALSSAMEEKIADLGLENHVFLHGTIPYEEMHAALDNATAFVGLGTAVIEAGLYGVPCIPAISYSNGEVYGLLHEQPMFYMGGKQVGRNAEDSTENALKRLLESNSAEYAEICVRTRTYCEDFSMEKIGPRYLDWFNQSLRLHVPRMEFLSNCLLCFVSQACFRARCRIMNTAASMIKRMLGKSLYHKLRNARRKTWCHSEKRTHGA
jgi:glycosyltransferase involved in cell wall biosynthesis